MEAMRRPHILVADDNAGHLRVMEMVLSAYNYDVTAVQDGHDALTFLQSHTPDLIIVDVQMPFMSGLDVLRRARRLGRLAETPAIVMTALEPATVAEEASAAGAHRVVGKPLTGTNLRGLVADALAKRVDPPAA